MEKILRVILVLVLIALLYLQVQSLFVAPVPDSIRWYGDESWLMTEALATVETGKLHHPVALSSTLSEPKSILFISVPWVRTLVYGIPAYFAFPGSNPVDVGRVVSFVTALVLLAIMLWIVARKTHSVTLALTATVILVASKAFFFASHSARYDLLTGSIVLVIAVWTASDRFRTALRYRRWFWLAFGSLTLAIGLPVYLYLYLAAIGVAAFVYYGGWREWQSWLYTLVGVAASTVVAVVIQLLMTGSVSIWSASQHQAEISDVTRDIPVFRIFSLSAQLAVLMRRVEISWAEAPWLFLTLPILIWSVAGRSRRSLLAISALVAAIMWYFFQRPHPAYMMHMLPLVLVATIVSIGSLKKTWVTNSVAGAAIILSVLSGIWMGMVAWGNGHRWSKDSEEALAALSNTIDRSGNKKPLVMVEAAANKALLTDTTIRLMTTHFQFFPDSVQNIEATLKQNGVDYAILFNSASYGYDRNGIDPLVKSVKENGDLVSIKRGSFFDIGRDDYDNLTLKEPSLDTFFLYRMRK